jgi:hypothetical protein
MPTLLLDLSLYASHTPSALAHLRGREDGENLCGDKYGFQIVVEDEETPDAWPYTLCPACAAAFKTGRKEN